MQNNNRNCKVLQIISILPLSLYKQTVIKKKKIDTCGYLSLNEFFHTNNICDDENVFIYLVFLIFTFGSNLQHVQLLIALKQSFTSIVNKLPKCQSLFCKSKKNIHGKKRNIYIYIER